jgi:hypothetical protein
MDEKPLIALYADADPSLDAAAKRKIAVEVALELIRLDTMNPASRDSLDSNLRHLSEYADMIQRALARTQS